MNEYLTANNKCNKIFLKKILHKLRANISQWETLFSKGRRKPPNVQKYQKNLHGLKDKSYAVKHAKFCCDVSNGSSPIYFVT